MAFSLVMRSCRTKSVGYLAVFATIFVPQALLAQPAPPVPKGWIESLCPTAAGTAFVIGASEADQPAAAMELLRNPGDKRAPFSAGSIVYTPWSKRVAGLSWESDLEYGDRSQEWNDVVTASLEEDGWSRRSDTEFGSSPDWDAVAYEKAFFHDGNERTLIFRLYTSGRYAADCGDADMLALYQREVVGDLEPGSPRPIDPGAPIEEAVFFARFDCQKPELITAFGKAGSVAVAGPLAESLISDDLPYEAQEDYEQRLGKWLEWKLLNSGKIEPEEIDSLYREADPGMGMPFEENFFEMVGGMEAVFEGLEEEDGAKTCSGYRSVLQNGIDTTKAQAERYRRLNAALIAQANRLGIDID